VASIASYYRLTRRCSRPAALDAVRRAVSACAAGLLSGRTVRRARHISHG